MSEQLPDPEPGRFPELSADPSWVRECAVGTRFARVFRAAGRYPSDWFDFREYGPLDARFDPHPLPIGEHPGIGVMYTVLEQRDTSAPLDSAFAACMLEVFQQQRSIRRTADSPTFAVFEITRTVRLLDLSESDWVAVAGGNAAITSGSRSRSSAWARAIREVYPELDGVVAASSVVPTARVAALWSSAADALPHHPGALIGLDRAELTGLIDAIAERYSYTVL